MIPPEHIDKVRKKIVAAFRGMTLRLLFMFTTAIRLFGRRVERYRGLNVRFAAPGLGPTFRL